MTGKNLLKVLLIVSTFIGAMLLGRQTKTETSDPPDIKLSTRENQSSIARENTDTFITQPNSKDCLCKAIEMALTLPSSEIESWITHSKFPFREGFAHSLFNQILSERWSREDPAAFLNWVKKNDGENFIPQLHLLFTNHPELLSQTLIVSQDSKERAHLLSLVAATNPDLALTELAKILPLPNDLSFMMQETLVKLYKTHPDQLDLLLENSPAGSNNPLLVASFIDKLSRDFDAGLDELFTRADGFEVLFPSSNHTTRFESDQFAARLSDFPKSWLNKLAGDPVRLFESLESPSKLIDLDWNSLGFSPANAQKMRLGLLNSLVGTEPEIALTALNGLDLTPEEKARFLQVGAFRNQSPEALSALSQYLESPEDRAHFLQEIETRNQSEVLTPERLVSDSNLGGEVLFGSLFRNWDDSQKDQFISAFQNSDPANRTRLASLMIDIPDLPLALEGQYIGQLLSDSRGHDLPGWGSDNYQNGALNASLHALKLLSVDTEQSTAWVEVLPDNPARIQVKQNLALNWRNLDPDGAQTWISSQPVTERQAIEEFLKER